MHIPHKDTGTGEGDKEKPACHRHAERMFHEKEKSNLCINGSSNPYGDFISLPK
jgi:hypothetical protein